MSFKIKEDTLICDELNITTDEISLSKIEDSNFLNRLKTTAQLTAKDISYKTLASDIFNAEIGMDHGVFGLSYSSPEYYDGNVSISIEPFKDIPSYAVNIEAQEFKYEQILQLLHQPSYVKGNGQFVTSLKAEGKNVSEILNSLNGKLTLGGDSLLMHGINVDEFIQKLNRSQNFNLADLGAFMVAGPIGLALTKGSDYTRLILTSSKDSSLLVRVNSDWDIKNGMLTSSDVAIATNKNRVALKGTYELLNDSLHLTVALLDANGCNAMSQTIEGSISKPKLGELQVIKSILKPVTNLVGDVIDTNCDPFYTGSVKHPE